MVYKSIRLENSRRRRSRRRRKKMSRSHLPLLLFFSSHEKMEWEREEGGASEREKLVEAIERDERSRRVPWKGPLMNSFPLSRGISPSLSRHPWNRCRALRWDFALAKLSPWVAHGGTKRAFTSLWPISRRHDLNNHHELPTTTTLPFITDFLQLFHHPS